MGARAKDPFSNQENEVIEQLLKLASTMDKSKNTKKMITDSPLAQGKKYDTNTKGQHTSTASYTTKVRSTLQELNDYIETEDNSSKFIEKTTTPYNDHHSIQYRARAFPNPVSDRETYASIITKTLNPDSIIKICVPCFIEEKEIEKERPLRPDRVRMEIRSMFKLTNIGDNMLRVDYYAEIEFGGYVPRWVIRRELPKFMSTPTRWQEHFQHVRSLRELTPEDGAAMGTMITLVKNRKSVETRLTTFLGVNVALKVSERSERAFWKTRILDR